MNINLGDFEVVSKAINLSQINLDAELNLNEMVAALAQNECLLMYVQNGARMVYLCDTDVDGIKFLTSMLAEKKLSKEPLWYRAEASEVDQYLAMYKASK